MNRTIYFKVMFFIFLLHFGVSVAEDKHPFNFDLHIYTIPGTSSKTMVVLHGMGSNYKTANVIKQITQLNETLVSFNFPDHDLDFERYNPKKTTFGTIQELLPAIFVLKKLIIDDHLKEVNLYGFSAGGGAIINILAVLKNSTYDSDLARIGVTREDKKRILEVLQKGYIILDAPLKSTNELIAFRGPSTDLKVMGQRYGTNQMEPIDALQQLEGLSFNFIVYFQNPDEVLSNRDDALYIERMKKYNSKGTTKAIIADEGGHISAHMGLWNYYKQIN